MRLFWLTLYYGLIQFLPSSSFRGFSWVRPVRRFVVARFAVIGADANIEHRAYLGGGRGVRVGQRSGVGIRAQIHGPVEIGDNVLMGPDVLIYSRNHETGDIKVPISQQGYGPERSVKICDDVWVGARVIILPGVTIGRGAVLGAGAVVTKSVEPFAVAAGNPARVMRSRRP